MITYYYINRQEVDQQYAQVVPLIVESIEEITKTSGKAAGKLAFGKWLTTLGLNLGESEIGGEWNRESAHKILRKLSEEQKLSLVWKKLRETGGLKMLTSECADSIQAGMPILFEGPFSILDDEEGEFSRIEGLIRGRKLVAIFSDKNMPQSVLRSLHYIPNDIPLSGYGTVMRAIEPEIVVRPIAFGLGFLTALGTPAR